MFVFSVDVRLFVCLFFNEVVVALEIEDAEWEPTLPCVKKFNPVGWIIFFNVEVSRKNKIVQLKSE